MIFIGYSFIFINNALSSLYILINSHLYVKYIIIDKMFDYYQWCADQFLSFKIAIDWICF